MNPEERFRYYDKPHAWQYDIRLKNEKEDLALAGFDSKPDLRVSDFEFSGFTKEHPDYGTLLPEIRAFIERHEWLGTLSNYPTHYFTARYNGILAGVVVFDMPNSFSKLLGEGTRKIERLISRGASVSWAPKNLGSALIAAGMRWVVENSRFRVFVAYSDPEAKELGTLYQAAGFYYLGQDSGATHKYKLPWNGKWVSDRTFRSRSSYKRYAKDLGIEWNPEWQDGDKIIWAAMPDTVEEALRQASRDMYTLCEKREIPPKHKYAYILGENKRETRELRKKLMDNNPDLPLPYPKERGV